MEINKQAVCITAYTNPKMLGELLNCLHTTFDCFVHIDKKVEGQFSDVKNLYNDVHFFSEFTVNWGGYEHLEAILLLFRKAVEANVNFIHLISGEDYPLISPEEIRDLFSCEDRIYIDCYQDIEGRRWKYYWPYVRLKHNYKKPVVRCLNVGCVALQKIIGIFKKKQVGEFCKIYGGYVWGDYPVEVVEYLLNYIDYHPKYMEEMKWVKIPEERCIHTIIANSRFAGKIQNNNKRFWVMGRNDWGPRYLTEADISELDSSNAIFGRKFQTDTMVFHILKSKGIN